MITHWFCAAFASANDQFNSLKATCKRPKSPLKEDQISALHPNLHPIPSSKEEVFLLSALAVNYNPSHCGKNATKRTDASFLFAYE
jgi:hypothetical protein